MCKTNDFSYLSTAFDALGAPHIHNETYPSSYSSAYTYGNSNLASDHHICNDRNMIRMAYMFRQIPYGSPSAGCKNDTLHGSKVDHENYQLQTLHHILESASYGHDALKPCHCLERSSS